MGCELTPFGKTTVLNVRTAAEFPKIPEDLSADLRPPVVRLKAGKKLTDEQIVEMVDREVELNSIP
ncbi:MAG: hypothetical protein ABIJ85_02590 [bacterium]